MSARVQAASATLPRAFGAGRRASSSARGIAFMGVGALVACVCCSFWIAVSAAGSRYLLELTSGAVAPQWAYGPLRGLSALSGSPGPGSLSAALLVLGGGYVLALACAGSMPLRWAMAAIVLANLAFTLGPTIVSTDVFGYIGYARELGSHGLNPYVSEPISLGRDHLLQFIYWKHQPSPYGPLFTLMSAPLGVLSAVAALWLFKAAAGLASIAIAMLVADSAKRRGIEPARAAIFVGLNPLLLFYAVSGAHNDLFAALLLVCAISLALRRREAAAGGAMVAAAAIKLTVGLALPFLVIGARRRGRAAWGAAAAAVLLAVPTLILFGPHVFGQLHRISTDPLFDTTFSGPDRLARAIGTSIDSGVRAACVLAAGALALIAVLWAWRGGDAIAAAGWALLALLASIASLAPWYLVWLLPLAALGRSRALRAATLLATAYLLAIHVPAFGGVPWLSQPPASTRVTTTVASFVRARERRADQRCGAPAPCARRRRPCWADGRCGARRSREAPHRSPTATPPTFRSPCR